jgi:hypothetical protein
VIQLLNKLELKSLIPIVHKAITNYNSNNGRLIRVVCVSYSYSSYYYIISVITTTTIFIIILLLLLLLLFVYFIFYFFYYCYDLLTRYLLCGFTPLYY